jgi:hypothetical protein
MFPGDGTPDHAEDLCVAFAGSGNHGAWIDKVVERAWKAIKNATAFDEACSLAEDEIKNTYREYGQIFQPGAMPHADLLYGIKMDNRSALFHADGEVVIERDKYDVRGSGYELGNFLAGQLWNVGTAPSLSQLIVLATYIVYEAKLNVNGVGGDTHLVALRNQGDSASDFLRGEKWLEQHFHYLDGFLGSAFLASFDIDTPDFLSDAHLSDLVDMLKLGRREMKDGRDRAIEFTRKLKEQQEKMDRANYPWRYRKPESENSDSPMPSESQKSEREP